MEEKNKLVKDDLFELIQSLTKSEKRYFKIYASRHIIGEEKKSILLFDYLDKQATYNHQKTIDYCKSFIKMKQFSISKNRLYTFILSALDLYYASSTIEAQIYKLLHAFEILFRKSLYAQCAKTIQKAEKLVEKHGLIQLFPEIQKHQKRLFETKNHSILSLKMIDAIAIKDAEIAHDNNLHTQLWTLKSKLFYQIATKGNARTEDEREVFKKLLEQIPNRNQLIGFETIYLYHHILSAYHFAIGNTRASYEHVAILLEIMQHHSKIDNKNTNRYIALLSNAIHLAEKLNNKNAANSFLQTLKSIANKDQVIHSEDLRLKHFATSASSELNHYIQRGELNKAEFLIPAIKENLTYFDSKIALPKKAYILFKISVVHLMKGNNSIALKEINSVLNLPGIEQVEALYSHAQLLAILIHLELKHNDLLIYSLKNTQRYLKSRKRLFAFETVFLKNIGHILKATHVIDAEERWEKLFHELYKLNYESDELELFDFLKWAEAKKQKNTFSSLTY
jgi:hypothetical protein